MHPPQDGGDDAAQRRSGALRRAKGWLEFQKADAAPYPARGEQGGPPRLKKRCRLITPEVLNEMSALERAEKDDEAEKGGTAEVGTQVGTGPGVTMRAGPFTTPTKDGARGDAKGLDVGQQTSPQTEPDDEEAYMHFSPRVSKEWLECDSQQS